MEKVLIDLDGLWGDQISRRYGLPKADIIIRSFPDKETYIRIISDVKGKEACVICSLNDPNTKTTLLVLLSCVLRENGALKVGLIAPYLAYMRQDRQFQPGEGVSARYYGQLLSQYFDWLITVDPHLHRIASLDEVYSIPAKLIHAAPFIARWIKENVSKPILIGPDGESAQWISDIAKDIPVPFQVLKKVRLGDTEVRENMPEMEEYRDYTPILVDDIISTARTMIEAVMHLKALKMPAPICIGVHAIFAGDAYQLLQQAEPQSIITCNTIRHVSNAIDISDGFAFLP